jgi:hypothetical protein
MVANRCLQCLPCLAQAAQLYNEAVRKQYNLGSSVLHQSSTTQLAVQPSMLVVMQYCDQHGEGNECFRLVGVVMREATAAEAANKVEDWAGAAAAAAGAAQTEAAGPGSSGAGERCWIVQWEGDCEEPWDEAVLKWLALPVLASR